MPSVHRTTTDDFKDAYGYRQVRTPCRQVSTKEQIKQIFKRFDKDGDAQLSKTELKAAFAELGAKWPAFRAWEGLRHADDNGDGFISIDKELDKVVDHAVNLGYTVN